VRVQWKIAAVLSNSYRSWEFAAKLLRMVIENELNEGAFVIPPAASRDENKSTDLGTDTSSSDGGDEYEIILRSKVELGITFSILHQENTKKRNQQEQLPRGNTDSYTSGLSSVASSLPVSSMDNRALLSEDGTLTTSASRNETVKPERAAAKTLPHPHFRRSHSTDDIGSYSVTSAWIVDKPMVKHCPDQLPEEYRGVQVGDVLEAVDGFSTGSCLCKVECEVTSTI